MQLGPDDPMIGLVLHVHRELMHHGAEISLLRDLYAAQSPKNPLYVAILNGDDAEARSLIDTDPRSLDDLRRDEPAMVLRAAELGRAGAIELAVGLGFDVDAMERMTALHHAAAGGNLEIARVLVDLGADLTLEDPH